MTHASATPPRTRRDRRYALALIGLALALTGCFRSGAIVDPPVEPERHSAPFDGEIVGIAGGVNGLHAALYRSTVDGGGTTTYTLHKLVGIAEDGAVTYTQLATRHGIAAGPLSDREGRAYAVVMRYGTDPYDYGFGPATEPADPWTIGLSMLVAYEADGTPRYVRTLMDLAEEGEEAHALGVAPDGSVVVCGYANVQRTHGFVRVFDPDGEERAVRIFDLPTYEQPTVCAIAERGDVLLYGELADPDHVSAGLNRPGLTLHDATLAPVTKVPFTPSLARLTADPRGFFVAVGTFEVPAYVGDTMLVPDGFSHVLAVLSDVGAFTAVTEIATPGAGRWLTDTTSTTRDTPVRYAYRQRAYSPTETLVSAGESEIATMMIGFGDDGAIDAPFSLDYASEDEVPDFATNVGDALWLVDVRDGTLFIEERAWRDE